MSFKIYNSLSEKKEVVNLKNLIKIYVCGVTPYDTTHIGHAFTFITYDVLVRYLRFLGSKVIYVQNVTDIDDDILIKAKSLGTSWQKLGTKEAKNHIRNMDNLNMLRPDYFPHATSHIEEMTKIIKVLAKKGYAYEKNGNIYFEVKKDKRFGKLSKLGYRAQLEIANDRGNYPLDPNKKDPLDFVLWQISKKGEPSWPSPWGQGRPGWHIECSTMSMKYLGPTITIHGGGTDLIFPHHEAEIAQSENYTDKKFVKHWLHTAMVYCEGKKMSKSLGNMIFVHDLLEKHEANTIRIFLLSQFYRTPWNYEEKGFSEAEEIIKLFKSIPREEPYKDSNEAKKYAKDFFKAIEDDLNIPLAIEELIKIAKSNNPKKGQILSTGLYILGIN